MQRTYWKIGAVIMLTSLAASGQTATAQTASGQNATAQTSTDQPSSGQPSSGQSLSGQSLGDFARQQREKQNTAATTTPSKVITNQDLGESPEGRPDLRVEPRPASFNRGYARQPGPQRAEQWRNQILEQKNRIADLQARIDRINSALHSGAQFEGAYSHDQAIRIERVSQLQMQIDEQTRRLEAMQDAARRAGLPSQTYDP